MAMRKLSERKADFISELARYLVEQQAAKSIQLQLGNPSAIEWAALRDKTPLFGYPTVDEAVVVLTEFLA